MRSFTTKLGNLFKMDTNVESANFDDLKRKMVIPLYQREYKWDNEKITTLLTDIANRDKFLGIIFLDEKESCYEVVDGQQRITTCFLTLLALYNYYKDSSYEQRRIESLIKPNGEYILINDSIGEYIGMQENELVISINETADVYYQRETFEGAYNLIKQFLINTNDVGRFREKLLDCEFLIIINNLHEHTSPVEQVFLDINEKSQLLEVEDIFKGHCFENFSPEFYDELRTKWVELKKCGMQFQKFFYYENTSQFIYLYLLVVEDKLLPNNLISNGKHYLEGKTMDQTMACLSGMIDFGKSVYSYYQKIKQNDYYLSDICYDSNNHRNTCDHLTIKHMSELILSNSSAQYQKIPFMHFINSISSSDSLKRGILHDEFRKIVTNLYIYSELFIRYVSRKSKKSIDTTLREALKNEDKQVIIKAAKTLRNKEKDLIQLGVKESRDSLFFWYSITDAYSANDNWIRELYSVNKGYNLEHFLVPDKTKPKIQWKKDDQIYEIVLSDEARQFKKRTINFLILDRELNERLERLDAVTKIQMIRRHFADSGEMPSHVSFYIHKIEEMQSYQDLMREKDNAFDKERITALYNQFILEYFKEENETEVLNELSSIIKMSFQN